MMKSTPRGELNDLKLLKSNRMCNVAQIIYHSKRLSANDMYFLLRGIFIRKFHHLWWPLRIFTYDPSWNTVQGVLQARKAVEFNFTPVMKVKLSSYATVQVFGTSKSVLERTRKMVNYACIGRSQGKLWWRIEAILMRNSFVKCEYRGERLIEPSSSWLHPKFPSG